MNTQEAIKTTLGSAMHIAQAYLGDLSDADLMERPVPTAHHIAWQIGHLITSENNMMEMIKPGHSPKLPAGFAEKHAKTAAGENDKSKFCTKKEYLDLWATQRRATLEILETLSDKDLDAPGPETYRSFAPTVGAMMILQGTHPLMHLGQWAIVRRKLNKPIVI